MDRTKLRLSRGRLALDESDSSSKVLSVGAAHGCVDVEGTIVGGGAVPDAGVGTARIRDKRCQSLGWRLYSNRRW